LIIARGAMAARSVGTLEKGKKMQENLQIFRCKGVLTAQKMENVKDV